MNPASDQHVMTVRGPISPDSLGVTMAHEHLLIDLTCLQAEPTWPWQEELVNSPPTLQNRALLSRDPYVSRPNLLLDEPGLAREELESYRALGGNSIIDLTIHGIMPRPEDLKSLSEATGVNIVMGCGFYVKRAHPSHVATSSVDALAAFLLEEIQNGVAGTDIRPGLMGELGTSSPIHPDEERVLRAAAVAQRETGLAINVHVSIFAREALNVLDILDDAGADLSRVVISHLDEMPDTTYHLAVLQRGAYVEFDTFGSEVYFDSSGQHEPADWQRVDCLLRLLDAGWAERLLVSQDVCTKMQLRHYGGYGYAHILRSIVPMLDRRGVDRRTIDTILVANPARVLAH